MPSARRSRRISAQSSTPNTPLPPQLDNEPGSSRVVSFRLPEGGQFSRAVDKPVVFACEGSAVPTRPIPCLRSTPHRRSSQPPATRGQMVVSPGSTRRRLWRTSGNSTPGSAIAWETGPWGIEGPIPRAGRPPSMYRCMTWGLGAVDLRDVPAAVGVGRQRRTPHRCRACAPRRRRAGMATAQPRRPPLAPALSFAPGPIRHGRCSHGGVLRPHQNVRVRTGSGGTGSCSPGAGQHLLGVGQGGLGQALLGLDQQGQQANVAGGGDPGHLGMRQHPGHRGGDPLLVVEGLVPGA